MVIYIDRQTLIRRTSKGSMHGNIIDRQTLIRRTSKGSMHGNIQTGKR